MPHPLAGVVDEEVPLPRLVLHGHVVFQPVAAGHGARELLPAEGGGNAGGDAPGVGGGTAPGDVEQHLPRHRQAPAAPGGYAHGGAAHQLKVCGEGAVDLEDLVLLEEAGVPQIGAAPGKLSGAAAVHAPAVRPHPVEHVEILGVPQLGAVNGIPLTAPQPVLVDTDVVHVGHLPGDGHGLRLKISLRGLVRPVQHEHVLIEAEAVAVLADLPYHGSFVVLRVLGAAGDLHGVPRREIVVEVDPGAGQGVALRLLLEEGAVVKLGRPGRRRAAGLQSLEAVRGGVVQRLIRENDDPAPHPCEDLPSGGDVPFFGALVIEAGAIHPKEAVQAADPAGTGQGPDLPSPGPGGKEGCEIAGQVAHVPQLPLPCRQGVVIAAEADLIAPPLAPGIAHTW